ncbi:hypothetical protein EYF80_028734 [Liparis tanakae]|uniref:Uncharacterized protein n=1 Tax=Liparis tanakae TaxID=230148 RepID=A0A4Z2H610_9TELE|nr:hypothetical protein EYF80_028734 [Liparis tanakae]
MAASCNLPATSFTGRAPTRERCGRKKPPRGPGAATKDADAVRRLHRNASGGGEDLQGSETERGLLKDVYRKILHACTKTGCGDITPEMFRFEFKEVFPRHPEEETDIKLIWGSPIDRHWSGSIIYDDITSLRPAALSLNDCRRCPLDFSHNKAGPPPPPGCFSVPSWKHKA